MPEEVIVNEFDETEIGTSVEAPVSKEDVGVPPSEEVKPEPDPEVERINEALKSLGIEGVTVTPEMKPVLLGLISAKEEGEAKSKADTEKALSETKLWASRAKQIAEKYHALADEVKKGKEALPPAARVKELLQGADVSTLSEDAKAFLQDEGFLEALGLITSKMIPSVSTEASIEEPETERELSPEETEAVKKHTDEQITRIAQVHSDYHQVYASQDFADWIKARGRLDQAKFFSPYAEDHIELISSFKSYVEAKKTTETSKLREKEKQAAMSGHGEISSSGISAETLIDQLERADMETFRKLRTKRR